MSGAARILALSLAAIAPLAPVRAQEIGRLFSTVEEREMLDEVRREYEYGEPVKEHVERTPAPEARDPAVSQLTINGVVVRSSGINSTWVNGSQVLQGDATREGVRVHTELEPDARVRITLPSGADTIRLKPGQKIDVGTGTVLEAYQYRSDGGPSAFDERQKGDAGDAPAGDGAVEAAKRAPREAAKEATEALEGLHPGGS